ncbi:hypothetical protein QCD60_19970 [Pokkaliibacter sp. MBI-7]|nr:hypothetical protein [Pokkaliibacter sp. MBI-7]MDH2434823.1 hypothetical protein [Pokkaliibacter sp. MBI-7]
MHLPFELNPQIIYSQAGSIGKATTVTLTLDKTGFRCRDACRSR